MNITLLDVKKHLVAYTGDTSHESRYNYLLKYFKPLLISVKLAEDGRFVISSKQRPGKLEHNVQRQAKGTIFYWSETNEVKILAVSSLFLQRRIAVPTDFTNCRVYKISDGTVINLYYYNNRWNMGSTNAWDISALKWMSTMTYEQMFNELKSGYPDFSFDKLDTGRTYTIGMRHHKIHPLTVDPQKLWYIQSINTAGFNIEPTAGENSLDDLYPRLVSYDDKIGLPAQESLDMKAYDIKQFMQDNKMAAVDFFKSGVIWYGFIVVKENSRAAIFDSNLLATVRKYIYFVPRKIKNSNNMMYDIRYMLLKAYLGSVSRDNIVKLFPQFSDTYDQFGRILHELAAAVLLSLRDNRTRDLLSVDSSSKAGVLLEFVKKFEASNLNQYGVDAAKIVMDTITNPLYAGLFYKMLDN